MKNFEYTDYAINKANDDAIVYRFANGEVREITAADFGGDEEAFLRWKNFSDEDYHKEDNHNRSISRKNVSMSGIEETELGSEKCFVEIEEMKEEDKFRRFCDLEDIVYEGFLPDRLLLRCSV